MKVKELREMGSYELGEKEKAFKKQLFDFNYQRRIGNVEKPSQFRALKRNIARIMTILRERELEGKKSDLP